MGVCGEKSFFFLGMISQRDTSEKSIGLVDSGLREISQARFRADGRY